MYFATWCAMLWGKHKIYQVTERICPDRPLDEINKPGGIAKQSWRVLSPIRSWQVGVQQHALPGCQGSTADKRGRRRTSQLPQRASSQAGTVTASKTEIVPLRCFLDNQAGLAFSFFQFHCLLSMILYDFSADPVLQSCKDSSITTQCPLQRTVQPAWTYWHLVQLGFLAGQVPSGS